jgi:hypothetical protein
MVEDAQNTKISARSWELLRWAKFELNTKSYSEVIVRLYEDLKDRQNKLKNSLQDFDESLHRVKSKSPQEESTTPDSLRPKTILLSPVARRILSKLKVESRESAYTFSDGIEFLIKQNKKIWSEIPKRLK